MECLCCYDDITDSNYVEYRTGEGRRSTKNLHVPWQPALFCEECIGRLLQSQWGKYVEGLAKSTCKAEQRRMLMNGPPINISDPTALPCPEGELVHSLWYASDKEVHSAKLVGSLEGEERQIWWDEKLAFQFDEPDEGEGRREGDDKNKTNSNRQWQAQGGQQDDPMGRTPAAAPRMLQHSIAPARGHLTERWPLPWCPGVAAYKVNIPG
ncbi:unnamed protein product [Discosporangium mesarthrocarpum]